MRSALILACVFFAASVVCAQAGRNQVVISEIMADPVAAIRRPGSLPESEFLELKNCSAQPLNLSGWKISDASGTATIAVNFILRPDSFVIITGSGAASGLSAFGTTLAVSNFPALDNDGEWIALRSKEGNLVHTVDYNQSWYQDAVKAEGGWSLEMVDTDNACTGRGNWRASTHLRGGTPGSRNSVDGINEDILPPVLLRGYAPDSMNIILQFDEPLDSLSAVDPTNYVLPDGAGHPQSVTALAPLFIKVALHLNQHLRQDKEYLVRVRGVRDCRGTPIGPDNETRVGLAVLAQAGDAVINEILFNPKPGGVDYVEIYNRGKHILDLKDLVIATRSNGTVSSLRQLSTESRLLFPQGYLAVSENASVVKEQYYAKDPSAFVELNTMPSYPDDGGTVVLLNSGGKPIDEVAYDEKWHFKLIDNKEGVALERIDFNKASQDVNNWFSAATDAGYGTPGYQNSQFKAGEQPQGYISAGSAVFSPDNDGRDDLITIHYQFPQPGYVCNITIFNVNGIPVRYLTRNALCGLTGYFRWDGLDEKGRKLNMGMYVMLAEVFNLQGKSKKVKQVITLAGWLN